MPEYDVNTKVQDMWTRGQIFRTAIIFIEIVVLLTAVLLNSMTGADTQPAAIAPLPETVVNQEVIITTDTNRVPTTIYVTSGFHVFVIQNTVHRLVGRLAECSNRYLSADFDGVLLSDSFTFSRHDIIHMATFLTDEYEVVANNTAVTLVLDDGRTYSVGLHCNGQLGMNSYSSQEAHRSTGLEDLVSVAQRHNNYAYDYFDYSDLEPVESVSDVRANYDYGAGYGCQGNHR